MKIVSNVLEGVADIHVYYIIGLLIFVSLFTVILIRTIRMPKSEAESIKNSILANDNDDSKDII